MSSINAVALPVPDNENRRRIVNANNKAVADSLATAGLYLFQTVQGTPFTPRFDQAEDALTVAEVAAAVDDFKAKHKYKPCQVGATCNPDRVATMTRRNIDASWSISCRASKLAVIADDGRITNLPEGAVAVPMPNGGRHIYFADPNGEFTNGLAHVPAPGSIGAEGRYGTQAHLLALRDAITNGTLPMVPEHIVALLDGAKTKDSQDMTATLMAEAPAKTTAPKTGGAEDRRAHNLSVGHRLIAAGVPVFASLNKGAVIPVWQKLDTDVTEHQKEAKREEKRAKGKPIPKLFGSTCDAIGWERMHAAYRDCTASICCGLAGIVVIDADFGDDGEDGPALLADYLDKHGGVPEGTVILTSRTGAKHYVFRDRERKYSNAEGRIHRVLNCNVRGRAGQIVAPGSWRVDGKRYGTLDDLQRFIDAITEETLPDLPQCLADLIGEQSGASVSDSDPKVQADMLRLETEEWPDYADVLGPGQRLDFERMKRGSDKFRETMDNPRGDYSGNSFSAASCIKGAGGDALDFAVLMREHVDVFGELVDQKGKGVKGVYTIRNIAKDFHGATPSYVAWSEGEAFEAVEADDETDAADMQKDKRAKLQNTLDVIDGTIETTKHVDIVLGMPGAAERLKVYQSLQKQKLKELEQLAKSEAERKVEAWYENAAFVPVNLDIDALPPRPYLYSTYLQRGHVTLLSASGGVGKSAWSLSVAIDLACGVDHLGAGDSKPRKVLVYNSEDDQDEMLRRAGAYMKFHNFTDAMRQRVRENVTIISGVNGALQFADYKDGAVVIRKKSVELFEQIIRERGIEVAMLDPLVSLHNIPENANSEMNKLIMAIKKVTADCNIATLVSHHDKKNIGNRDVEDASQDDSRGAGAITTPVRVVLAMKRLSKKDVSRFRIPAEDVPRIVALSKGAKSNYSARDASSRLLFANSVQANNGSEEFAADSTVALSVYKLRALGPRISDDQRDAILAEIAKGEFRSDAQTNGPIVQLMADIAGFEPDPDGKRYAATVLAEWLKLGWVVVEKAKVKGYSREVPVYKLGPTQPPIAGASFEAVDDEDE